MVLGLYVTESQVSASLEFPLLEYRAVTSQGSTFAACVRDISRPSEPSAYSWLVWGPRAFQREGESASRLGAWERIEAAARYGASVIA
jgi:hypothetical protein